VSEGSALSDGLKTAVGEFYNNYGRFSGKATPANVSYGVATDASIAGSYVSKVQISNTGTINAYYGGPKANAKIGTAAYLTFSPITHAGSIEWRCKNGSGITGKWLPSSCQ
jgi:type IV pilus assembly protein PilA